jgi:class 3 adenylate cyclase
VSGRLERAVVAFLRQEFGSSVTAITGFIDILVEDASRQGHMDLVPDLERMRAAAEQLSALIAQTIDLSPRDPDATARLRHQFRTPLNAIKGYGELLVEELNETGPDTLLTDLGKVLDLADRLLGEIDRIVETAAAPPLDIVGSVLQTVRPLDEVDITDVRAASSQILVVDDNLSNRDLLSRRLMREGFRVTAVESGEAALAATAVDSFDLVLLDMMMPGLSGFEVLCRLKADARTRHVPVIMISALDELDSAVRCIAAGAEDYLPKPFNPVVLRARVGASLEKKRLLDELRVEKERSEALLLNILPHSVVERMRRGEVVIADRIPEATVLFSDLVDFTAISASLAPEETVKLLGALFSQFDNLAICHGLETIKTIGDGYMVTSGILGEASPERATAVAEMALSMLDATDAAGRGIDKRLQLRIGIHTGGPIVAGVLGTHKIAYDVWGDAVNTAKRMESYGLPGRVHVSAATRKALGNAFRFEPRGPIDVKGKGPMETYFLYRR